MFQRLLRKMQSAQAARFAIETRKSMTDADFAAIGMTRDTYVATVAETAVVEVATKRPTVAASVSAMAKAA